MSPTPNRFDRPPDTFGTFGCGSQGLVTPLLGTHTILANEVFNPAGEDLGRIQELMIDIRTGSVAYAVLSFGGWMGLGNKLFAVPWAALTLDAPNKRFTIEIRRQALMDAQGFDKERWPSLADPAWSKEPRAFHRMPSPLD